jgi:hypothetical protein
VKIRSFATLRLSLTQPPLTSRVRSTRLLLLAAALCASGCARTDGAHGLEPQGAAMHADAATADPDAAANTAPGTTDAGLDAGPEVRMMTTDVGFRGVWGSDANDVWLVGGEGKIVRYDGSKFRLVDSGTDSVLSSVHGSAADDVWIAGADGTTLHWEGSSF